MALFHNWTTETFSTTWNKIPFQFEPGVIVRDLIVSMHGDKIMLEPGIAQCFAKHLAMREMNKAKLHISLDSIESHKFYTDCLQDAAPVGAPAPVVHPIGNGTIAPPVSLTPATAVVEEKAEAPVEAEEKAKKGGRPKKSVTAEPAKPEEKFEGVE